MIPQVGQVIVFQYECEASKGTGFCECKNGMARVVRDIGKISVTRMIRKFLNRWFMLWEMKPSRMSVGAPVAKGETDDAAIYGRTADCDDYCWLS